VWIGLDKPSHEKVLEGEWPLDVWRRYPLSSSGSWRYVVGIYHTFIFLCIYILCKDIYIYIYIYIYYIYHLSSLNIYKYTYIYIYIYIHIHEKAPDGEWLRRLEETPAVVVGELEVRGRELSYIHIYLYLCIYIYTIFIYIYMYVYMSIYIYIYIYL